MKISFKETMVICSKKQITIEELNCLFDMCAHINRYENTDDVRMKKMLKAISVTITRNAHLLFSNDNHEN